MAKDNKNNELNHDELLDIAIKEYSKDIDKETPSAKAQYKSLEDHFIKQGIWEESIFSKIFYWPTRTIDRIIVFLKTFMVLMLGVGIATLQMNYVLTRGDSVEVAKQQSTTINREFSSIIVKSNDNPVEFSQQIILSAMRAGLTTEIKQTKGEITLFIMGLEKNEHISLKALLGQPPQFYGNIKVIINE